MPDPNDKDPAAFGVVNGDINFEDAIPMSTIQKLRAMGHDANIVSGWQREMMGRGQIIQKIVDASGQIVWAAGCDPRSDGHAVAQI
jgi:gamma-glutamyltranspeptidase/glutathione hydrolase